MGGVGDFVGKAVGTVTDAVGLTNYGAQETAQNIANTNAATSAAMSKEQIALAREQLAESRRAADQSAAINKEALDYQKAQYQDWKDIYGETQASIFQSVMADDGSGDTAMKLQNQQQEYQNSLQNMDTQLAQRGLDQSGVSAAALTALNASNTNARASIRSSQDDVALNKKMQLLGLGLGQGAQMLGTVAGVSNTGTNAQANIAGINSGAGTNLYNSAAGNTASIANNALGVAGSIANQNSANTTSFINNLLG